MKRLRRIIKWSLISILSIIGIIIISIVIYKKSFYEWELKKIKTELNKIENVEVLDIWGHKDITLEEISVRIQIKNKGEIVLNNLSNDVYNYPNRVPITEIGGYSFTRFTCYGQIGINPSIDLSENTEIGNMIGITFNSPKDVIENYDKILAVIRNLKMSPELNYYSDKNFEEFILISKLKTTDQDPIYNLIGIEGAFEFAKTLDWKNSECKNW